MIQEKDRQHESKKNLEKRREKGYYLGLKDITSDEGLTPSLIVATQFVHNLILFKTVSTRFGPFSFCKHHFCSPKKLPCDSTNVVIVSHLRILKA